jgi:hypothetical protein
MKINTAYAARVLLIANLLLIASCSHSARVKTINATITAVDAAHEGLVEWDKQERTRIVDQATSRDEAVAKLSAQDTKIAPVVVLVASAYRALVFATVKDDDRSVTTAVELASQVADAIKKIRSRTTGGP